MMGHYFLESAKFIHNERVQETQLKLADSSTGTIQQALKYQKPLTNSNKNLLELLRRQD